MWTGVRCVDRYVDPGKFVTNTQAGANYGYLLMWCVFGASLLAMPVHYLSARLGIVTGKSLAAVCRSELPRCASLILWTQAEIVAMCTELTEFVGAALGINLLFDVPLPVARGMTAIIAFVILRMQRVGAIPDGPDVSTGGEQARQNRENGPLS